MANYSEVGGENVELLRALINNESYDGEITSRNSAILDSIIKGSAYTDPPQSEIEALLLDLKEKIEGGGSIEVEELNVTENGTYTADIGKAFNPVNVDIASPVLITKNITANGTYNASDDNADGYSSVSVNVPLPSNAYLLKSIEHESMATFSDGTDNFLKSLAVAIEPQQDLHGYDHPWVGGSGKNKFNIATISVKEYIGENGNLYSSDNWSVSDFISVDSETAYVLSGITNSGSLAKHAFYDSNKVFISAIDSTVMNFTTPSNAKYIKLSLQSETPTNVQLEKGSTATTFAPYSNICPISGWDECKVTVADDLENPTVSNVYTIDLDGTRYGGKLDVVNGVLTVDRVYKQVKDFEWRTQGGNYGRFFIVPSEADKPLYDANKTLIISDTYKGYSDADKPANTNGVYIGSGGALKVWDSEYPEETDVDAWKTARANVELCYYLATPQTIQLTPTIIKSLQGENNLFASTGEIERMQYWGKEQN